LKFNYFWWDLEKSEFKGYLYNTIGCFYLYDHNYENWEEFEKCLPHMAYTHLVFVRFEALEQLFVDLRIVTQMLGVEDFPIKSPVKDINRHQWLKSAVDLKLMRFSAIRDTCFHLVNELLELGINKFDLNFSTLKKSLKDSHPILIDILKDIAFMGKSIRKERNDRFHRGIVNLSTDDDEMFKNIAWIEGHGRKAMNYDIESVYRNATCEIYKELIFQTNNLLKRVIGLLDLLIQDYNERYQQKLR